MSSGSDFRYFRRPEEQTAPPSKRSRQHFSRPSKDLRRDSPKYQSPSPTHTQERQQALQYQQITPLTPRQSFSPSSNGSFTSPSLPPLQPWQPSPCPAPRVSRKLGDTTFRYGPLEPQSREVRLLRILPETSPMIECEILHTSLLNPRSYIAISYVWGDVEDTQTVLLDGHEFPVTENLWHALQRLRTRSYPVIVWADAVCINQNDTNERNLQVQLMVEIYGKAYSVAIWLGPQADNSHLAVELMYELVEAQFNEQLVKEIIHAKARRPYFQGLITLFRREYWNRLWVVQEAVNATEITVYCGNLATPWALYRDASRLLSKYKSDLVHAETEAVADGISSMSTGSTGKIRRSIVLSAHGPARIQIHAGGMLDFLIFHRDAHCSDPRDKVFGLLGILSFEERNQFGVNYDISKNEVYINIVDYLLATTRRLDVLCASIHTQETHTTTKLPSWVPDWSYDPHVKPIYQLRPFCASGKSDAQFIFSHRRKKVDIKGILIDTIGPCGIRLGPQIDVNSLGVTFLAWRSKLMEQQNCDVAAHEAFCRILRMNLANERWSEEEWMQWTYHTFAILLQHHLPILELDPQLKFYSTNSKGLPDGVHRQTIIDDISVAMAGRRFCMTMTGLLCLGSSFLTKDDIVIVPLGCSTPIVLRRENQGYTFVGDIYVDGYMYGKAIDELNSGVRQLQSFVMH